LRECEARSDPGGIGAYKRSNETPLLCICFKESVCTGEVFVLELLRKNIHMDRIKGEAQTQIVLEDDINITDAKPDVFMLVTEKGDIQTEEIRVMEDHVHVRGKLHFCVFYLSDEEIHRPASMEGTLPFEEKIFVKGIAGGDNAVVETSLEDLSVGMINSRKLSVQAVARLHVYAEGFEDVMPAVGIVNDENAEIQKKNVKSLHLAICKKDIFRIRKELELPAGMPNIFQPVWQSCRVKDIGYEIGDENMRLHGELEVFLFYEGEGEQRPFQWYETSIPISGSLECQGMRREMLEDIRCRIGHKEMEIKADEDGEERKIGLELVLDLDMKLYEEIETELLSDIYSVEKEVEAIRQTGQFQVLLSKNTGKCRVNGRMQLSGQEAELHKICMIAGDVIVDHTEVTAEGILVRGSVEVRMLYSSKNPDMPFGGKRESIPFSYTLEIPQAQKVDGVWRIDPVLEQLQAAAVDTKEVEVKAQLSLKSFVCRQFEEPVVTDIQVKELDHVRINALPGMVVYFVQPADTLWNIGKRYYVPVQSLKEMNGLTGDEIRVGDKLLIVKGA